MRKSDLETGDKYDLARILAERHGWICAYCGCKLIPFGDDDKYCSFIDGKWVLAEGFAFTELDHKVPVSRGGSNDIENMALSCRSCNRRKNNKTAEEFTARRAK